MATRRGNGEGAVYKRGDGRWVAAVDLGWHDGKRKRKVVYGATRREVSEKLKVLARDAQRGALVLDDRRPLGDFLDVWLSDVVKPSVRDRTYLAYEEKVRVHVKPALARVPLNKLTTVHVQRMLAAKTASGLSNRTVEFIWQVLSRALNVAVRWNLVARNVAALASPPRPRHDEVQPFSIDQLRAILAAAADDRFEAAFVLAVTCGLRRGEILGLKWSDIELDDQPSLRVRRVLQRVGRELATGDPKSSKSRRTIALSKLAVSSLRRHRARQAEARLAVGAAWREEDWVFTVADGGPVDPRNLLRAWHGVLARAALPKRPLHHARHGAASLMLSEGLPLKLVQETLGHSTMRLTADLYGHLMPGDAARVADALDRAFGA